MVSGVGSTSSMFSRQLNEPTRSLASGITPKASFEQILADFKKLASETPAERIKDAVLKKHGLTKEDFNKLPAAEQDLIAREIQEAVKRAIGIDKAQQHGFPPT